MIRTIKTELEFNLKRKLGSQEAILAWLIEHAGVLISRHKVGDDGKTAYERIKGKRPSNQILQFGEKVRFMPGRTNKGHANKLEPRFKYGIYLGVHPTSSEAYIATENGAMKARTVRRLIRDNRWDPEMIAAIKGVPWATRREEEGSGVPLEVLVQENPAMQEEAIRPTRRLRIEKKYLDKHGYTEGCKGCRAIRMGGPPVTHSEACRKRVEELIGQTPEGMEKLTRRKEAMDKALAEKIKGEDAKKRKAEAAAHGQDAEEEVRPASSSKDPMLEVESRTTGGDEGGTDMKDGKGDDEERNDDDHERTRTKRATIDVDEASDD